MPRKFRRRPLWLRLLGWFVYALLCTTALAIGTVGALIERSDVFREALSQRFGRTTPQDVFGQDSLNVLVLGCDEDLTPGGKRVTKALARSDMMLLAHLDFERGSITGVAIPRDTLLGMSGYRPRKINAYHAIGGPPLAKRAVEALLPGILVDHVITLDFNAFQDVVNLVGGVPIEVGKNLNYDDNAGGLHIHLKKGYHLLNGYQAMGFVRYRHGDSDFARTDRQAQFVMAFKEVLTHNVWKLHAVSRKATQLLGGLNAREVACLANFANRVPRENVHLGAVPVNEISGSSNLTLDSDKLGQVLAEYRFTSDAPEGAS